MKTCSVCKQKKPAAQFHKRRVSKDGLQPRCKCCVREKSQYNPEVYRRYRFKKVYGITIDDFNRMLQEQAGRCAICGSTEAFGKWEQFCVDHCHVTGEVRGLLCNGCNQGLGYFNDNPDLLNKAAKYLGRN